MSSYAVVETWRTTTHARLIWGRWDDVKKALGAVAVFPGSAARLIGSYADDKVALRIARAAQARHACKTPNGAILVSAADCLAAHANGTTL